MNILFQQTFLFYEEKFLKLYDNTMELVKFFDEIFIEKNDNYINLLFFVFRQQYRNIFNEEIRIKLVESFFQNKLLLKHSKIFLSELLNKLKPEIYESSKRQKPKELLLLNFMNLEIIELIKYRKLFEIIKK